jgi:hypothetical protein
MLLGFIRIVPLNLRLEVSRLRIEFDRSKIGTHDAFQSVYDNACTQTVERSRPGGSIAETHRVVITIGETKAHEEAARRLASQRIDQLLPQQSHGGCAEDDHSLLVEPNDAFIGPKVEELRKLQTSIVHLSTILRRVDRVQRGFPLKETAEEARSQVS